MKRVLTILLLFYTLAGCDSVCDCDGEGVNHSPAILEILASPPSSKLIYYDYGAYSIESITVTAVAIDEDSDSISYHWSSSAGTITTGSSHYSTTSNPASWKPPNIPGDYTVTCIVSDGKLINSKTVTLKVIQ